MTFQRRTFLRLAIAAAALAVAPQIAWAQAYPTRPITLIVPFPPGGSTDVGARIVADHMSRTLGQQVIIQNVSGAGGTTGHDEPKRALFTITPGGNSAGTRCQVAHGLTVSSGGDRAGR